MACGWRHPVTVVLRAPTGVCAVRGVQPASWHTCIWKVMFPLLDNVKAEPKAKRVKTPVRPGARSGCQLRVGG